jgi:hypothetical protein
VADCCEYGDEPAGSDATELVTFTVILDGQFAIAQIILRTSTCHMTTVCCG